MVSDGLLRIYTLTTPYGEFTVHGDQMLRMRINELAALYELEKIANSESYGKALLDAGLSPFKYTGRLITDPKRRSAIRSAASARCSAAYRPTCRTWARRPAIRFPVCSA